ncbi:transcriptional regulator domain-containing protein [Novosphingobium profundi]|uniref:transcriptional regulator domain-containing protein n=1 Tax=Novosphingobium profundi TaxID=1774954 RepID=UPI0039B0ABD3
MWEWLRRDAGYVAWQARASHVTGGPRATRDLVEADGCLDLAPRDWGLHFRRGPGPGCPPGADHLACRA